MGPKSRAEILFLEGGGREVIITSPPRVRDSIEGRAGTRIVPD
jgi:carbamate kinase